MAQPDDKAVPRTASIRVCIEVDEGAVTHGRVDTTEAHHFPGAHPEAELLSGVEALTREAINKVHGQVTARETIGVSS